MLAKLVGGPHDGETVEVGPDDPYVNIATIARRRDGVVEHRGVACHVRTESGDFRYVGMEYRNPEY